MSQPIQLGLRIVVDKGTAVDDVGAVTTGVGRLGSQAVETSNALAAAMASVSPAVTNVGRSMSALSETEAQATERIRAMVAESVSQASAFADSARGADQASASIRRTSDEAANYAAMMARVNASMTHVPTPATAAPSSDEALKYVASLQRQYDQVGKNSAEIAQYEAKLRGANAATQAHAYAIVSDTEALRDQVLAEKSAGQAADAFLAKLKSQTEALGLNRTQLLEQRAAQLGVTEAAAPMIARIADAGQETHKFSLNTAASKRELLVLAHELSQGNFKGFGGSMMVLGEQTGAAGLLFSSTGLAIAGVVATLGLLSYAAIKGTLDQKHMDDALIMTGGYAGVTSDKLNDLAHSATEAGGSIGEAKKVVTELAGAGKFTGDQIGYITEATVAWEHATGKSVQSTIKEFESLAVQTNGSSARATEAISRATLKLDDTYHFLTESVYEQIRALEKEGDAKAASALATENFAKVTHERAEEIIANAGSIAKAWNAVKETIGGVADALGNVGKRETPALNVKKYSTQLDYFDKGLADSNARLGRPADEMSASLAASRLAIVMKLTGAVDELNKADAAAIALGERDKVQSEGAHAAARVLMDNQKLEKKGWSELDLAIRAYGEDLAKIQAANPDSALLSQDAVDEHMAALRKAHTKTEKATPGSDDRKATLDGAMRAIQDEVNAEKAKYQQLDSLAQLYHRGAVFTDGEFYAARLANLNKSESAEIGGYDKQLTTLRSFNAKTAVERQDNLNKINEAGAARTRAEQQYADKRQLLTQEEELRQAAVVTASDEAMNKSISDINLETQKQREANIGRESSRASIERETVARLDSAIAYQQVFMAEQQAKGAKADEVAQAQRTLKFLEDQRTAHQALSEELAKGDQLKFDNKMWKLGEDEAKSFAQSMQESFGKVGGSIGKMTSALFEFKKTQHDVNEELERSKGTANGDPAKLQAAETAASRKNAQAQIKQYGDMASAASGFFKQNTAGYKILHGAEEGFRAFQLALSVQNMVQQLTATTTTTAATVTGEAAKATAVTTGAAVQVAANQTVGMSAATAGVANQAAGDPYSAFIRIAAMAAIMAGLGFAVGGGSGSGPDVAKARQEAAGTGSVLGDSKAKSDSIAKSLDLIAENSDIELNHTGGMLVALRNIESSISGLGNILVRGGKLTGEVAPDTLGSAEQTFNKLLGNQSLGEKLSGGLLGKVVNGIFGGRTSVTDTGFTIDAASLGSILTNGAHASQYTDTHTDGGIFHSDKNNTSFSALGTEENSQFTKVFANLGAGIGEAAKILLIDGAGFTDKLNSFVVDIGKVSFKGLTGQQIQEQLETIFSKVGDDLAKQTVPGLLAFQKVGEGAFETLTRLANDYASVDAIMSGIGKTFNTVGLDSIAARERLIDMAGGIDKLAAQTSSFGEDFLSDAERLAPVEAYVKEQLAALGLSGITSREAFKNVVLGIDESTESGAKLFTSLMALEGAFAQVYGESDKVVMTVKELAEARADQETAIYEASHTAVQNLARQRMKELAAMDASLQPMQKLLYVLQDQATATTDLTDKIDDARDVLKKSYDAEATQLKSLIKLKESEAASTIKQMDALKLGNLSTLTPEQKLAEARKQFDSASGDDKNTAASAYLEALKSYYGSSDGYVQGYAQVQAQLAIQAASASSAATVATSQLDALNKQVSGQIEINDSVVSVKTAIDKLTALVAAKATLGASADGSPKTDVIEELYKGFLNRHSDAAGYAFYQKEVAAGTSLATIVDQFLNSPEYAQVHGSHKTGLSNVPFNGYIAELHKDEAVLTAEENAIWKALNTPTGGKAQSTTSDAARPLAAALQAQAKATTEQNVLLEKLLTAVTDGNSDLADNNDKNTRAMTQSLSTLITKVLAR